MTGQVLEQAATGEVGAGDAQQLVHGRVGVGPVEVDDGALRVAQRLENAEAIERQLLGGAETPLAREAAVVIAPGRLGRRHQAQADNNEKRQIDRHGGRRRRQRRRRLQPGEPGPKRAQQGREQARADAAQKGCDQHRRKEGRERYHPRELRTQESSQEDRHADGG